MSSQNGFPTDISDDVCHHRRLCPFTSQVLKYLQLWEALDIAALVATISQSSAQPAEPAQKHAGPTKVQQSKAILLLQRIVAGAPSAPLCLPVHQHSAIRLRDGSDIVCCSKSEAPGM